MSVFPGGRCCRCQIECLVRLDQRSSVQPPGQFQQFPSDNRNLAFEFGVSRVGRRSIAALLCLCHYFDDKINKVDVPIF